MCFNKLYPSWKVCGNCLSPNLGYALIFAEAKEAKAKPVVIWKMFNIMVRVLQTEEIETILQSEPSVKI